MPIRAPAIERHHNLVILAVLAGLAVATFHRTYPVDDAYISFRYALNLAEGKGLEWNPGERVEGYSNFLWTLLIALGMKWGVHPERFSVLLAVPIHLAALVITLLLAQRLLDSRRLVLLVVILTGLNHSVLGFATSGLETSLQLLEFTAAAWLVVVGVGQGWTVGRTAGLGVVLNLALLTRPDAVIPAVWGVGVWLVSVRKPAPKLAAALAVPFGLILVPYLVWKWSYFGTIVPNAFHAKVRGLSGVPWGFYYLYLFSIYYLVFPFWFLTALNWRRTERGDRAVRFLGGLALLWLIYVVGVGGDFMEFRFLVPVIPILMILFLRAVKESFSDGRVVGALALTLLVGTLTNAFSFAPAFYSYGVERVERLWKHLYGPGEDWVVIGKRLGEMFEGTGVKIACGPAGAIPYYSGLEAVDLIGLTDREIPRIGESFSAMAGHRIISPLDYLHRRGVNLIVQPINLVLRDADYRKWLLTADWEDVYRFFLDIDLPVGGEIRNEATLVGVPLGNGYTVVMWYFAYHPAVEEAVAARRMQKVRLVRR